MSSGRASVPFPQRRRVAHRIPTLARGNEIIFAHRIPTLAHGNEIILGFALELHFLVLVVILDWL